MVRLQAVSVPIAYGSCAPRAAVPWDRQTDIRTDRGIAECSPTAGIKTTETLQTKRAKTEQEFRRPADEKW